VSSNQQLLLGEGAGSAPAVFIEDVFSTYLYASTSGTDNQVVNGIDLSTKSGLVWSKSRTRASTNHYLIDTVRGSSSGNTNALVSNTTAAQSSGPNLDYLVFNSNGYTAKAVVGGGELGTNTYYGDLVSWTFRKQPKFFDVVTYTGDGVAGRTVAHNLGSVPGCFIVKCTSNASTEWFVYHRSLTSANYHLRLSETNAEISLTAAWNDTSPTSSVFTLGTDDRVNGSGRTYVAYLFAHDAGGFGLAGTDNVISCGSYTGTGAVGNTITVGYEPQWVMIKASSGTSAAYQDWYIYDNMRGMPVGTAIDDQRLMANLSSAEASYPEIGPTATGFVCEATGARLNESGTTYIYIAIRRGPMKVPTVGTSVYNAITYTGDGTANRTVSTTIQPDLLIQMNPSGNDHDTIDRLRGVTRTLYTNLNYADDYNTNVNKMLSSMTNTGFVTGSDGANYWNGSSTSKGAWAFRRAPGFFDEVCYTNTGSSQQVAFTTLGTTPELVIYKARGTTSDWYVLGKVGSLYHGLKLNTTAASAFNDTAANLGITSTYFNPALGWGGPSSYTYVAYFFATCPGVSKVGSYTGNGSSQTIACGFTAGSRFVMIKRTDSTGDWYVWDSARGIVAGNDPHLSLNDTAAEVTTDDSVDTDNSGFIVNQLSATNVNVTSATYIFLAIA